jgi:hypothetical protein
MAGYFNVQKRSYPTSGSALSDKYVSSKSEWIQKPFEILMRKKLTP